MTSATAHENPRSTEVALVTIGETMVLLAPPPHSSLVDADSLTVHIGGAESNVAMYLAELGHRVEWVGAVGHDPFGEIVLTTLGDAGVGLSAVQTSSLRTGVYFKDSKHGRTTVHYYRDGSAATNLDASVYAHPAIRGARVLHLTGITAALSASCRDLVEGGTLRRALPGAMVSFDVNYRPALWRDGSAQRVLTPIANASDVVFVGLDEARALWGCESPQDVRELLPAPRVVIVKNDEIGAHSFVGSEHFFAPSPRVEVVEPVGAGDAFAAGYLAGTLDGLSEVARLRMGHLLASRTLMVTSDHAELPPIQWFREHVDLPESVWETLDFALDKGATE